jgi:hypothetical protein
MEEGRFENHRRASLGMDHEDGIRQWGRGCVAGHAGGTMIASREVRTMDVRRLGHARNHKQHHANDSDVMQPTALDTENHGIRFELG